MGRTMQVKTRFSILEVYESSLGVIREDVDIPRRKRSKRSSSAARMLISSSKLKKNINIDDLPEVLLVEILCRLPCNKFAFRCKCVSKRWCAIISHPPFIRHFLCLQTDKHTPIVRTMINYNRSILLYNDEVVKITRFDPVMARSLRSLNSFLNTVQFKFTDLVLGKKKKRKLTDLVIERPLKLEKILLHFKIEERRRRFLSDGYLKSGIVGTYNDLFLCCVGENYQCYYYICNPYTQQRVALPPSPQCHKRVVAVGFICDYTKKATDQINNVTAEYVYRHRVVRIPEFSYCQAYTFKYYVEIFSSEIGEWRASYISFPKKFAFHSVNPSIGFAHKGMLFWVGRAQGRAFLIGFDPFNTEQNPGTIEKKCFIEFDEPAIEGIGGVSEIECLGVCQGCLRMFNFELRTGTLLVWDFKLLEPADQMVNGGNCLILKHRVPMDPEILTSYKILFSHNELDMRQIKVCAFDPNDEDILYLGISTDLVMCNIRTKKWFVTWQRRDDALFLPLILHPQWPTPVPRLPR